MEAAGVRKKASKEDWDDERGKLVELFNVLVVDVVVVGIVLVVVAVLLVVPVVDDEARSGGLRRGGGCVNGWDWSGSGGGCGKGGFRWTGTTALLLPVAAAVVVEGLILSLFSFVVLWWTLVEQTHKERREPSCASVLLLFGVWLLFWFLPNPNRQQPLAQSEPTTATNQREKPVPLPFSLPFLLNRCSFSFFQKCRVVVFQ